VQIRKVGKFSIWFNAWRDGRNNQPGVDHGPEGTFLGELKETADSDIASLTELYDLRKRRHTERLDLLSAHVSNLEQELQYKEARYGTDGRAMGGNASWAKFGAYLGLCIVLLLETPLNIAAFRFLGEAEIYTIGLAFGLSICLSVLVHFIGKRFKAKTPSLQEKRLTTVAIAMIAITVLGVSVFRHILFVHEGNEANLFIDIGFIFLQFTFLSGGVFLTYIAYNPVGTCKLKIDECKIQIQLEKSQRESLSSLFANQIQSVINETEVRITYYAKINRRYRKDKSEIPKMFLSLDHAFKYEIKPELANSVTARKVKHSEPWAS
jgi:hypothetical protein